MQDSAIKIVVEKYSSNDFSII